MRGLLCFSLAFLLVSCGAPSTNESQTNTPTVNKQSQTAVLDVPDFSINSLSNTKQHAFRKILPDKTRDFLETAPEFTVTVRERKFLLDDARVRKQLLDAIYWDVANSIHEPETGSEVACLETYPRITVTRQNEDMLTETAGIVISYYCGKIQVSTQVFPFKGHPNTTHPFDGRTAISKQIFERLVEIKNETQQ